MELHYNAFISYRHHPDDIRVASEIHRSLERFHVPRSIRKTHGKIDRLFRDKEELPITSNLNDDIGQALKNSDYLIVICSVHTKESIWVQREIELFLKSHHRSKVLTVLASGEPYDVIPEILLYEDVTDPVTGQVQRVPVEPLSCDWRGKRRHAMREELPRLAAPLLGCSYDELRQRQKQYRARRNMTIVSTSLAASLCLTAYFLYTSITIQRANIQIQKANEEIKAANIQIQANLDASLINQSRHLATAAQERLAAGDRLTAISLAMAALPSEGNQRPYVPEAENTLISALGIYRTSNQPTAVGTVSPGVNIGIQKFWVADAKNIMYIYDQRRNVTVWNTQTLEQTGQISMDGMYLDKLMVLPNGNALIRMGMGDNVLRCYGPDGALIWQQENCRDMAYSAEKDQVLILHQKFPDINQLVRLNASTGKTVGEPLEMGLADSDMDPTTFLDDTLAGDTAAVLRYYSFQGAALYAVDLSTGHKVQLPTEEVYPGSTLVTQDGLCLIMGPAEGLGIAGTLGEDRVTSEEIRNIACFDLHSGELLWKTSISNSVYGSCSVQEIPGSSQFLCQSGNVFQVISKETGEILARCEAGGGILYASAGEQYASAVLQDGYVCYYWYAHNYCYEVKSMDNGVNLAAIGEKWYAQHAGQDHVTIYTSVMGEPEWYLNYGLTTTVKNLKTAGNYLAFQDYSYLYLLDTETQTLCWAAEKGSKELLGFSQDGTTLWYADGNTHVTSVNIATGAEKTKSVPIHVKSSTAAVRGTLLLQNDRLYYAVGNLDVPVVACWDLNTNELQTCPLSFDMEEEIAYWSWEPLAAGGEHVWLWGQMNTLLEVDMATGNVFCLSQQTPRSPAVVLSQDAQTVAIANDGSIYLKAPGQKDFTTITLENANAGSLCFQGEHLLALCDNGVLYRLDSQGTCLAQTALQVDDDFASRLLSSSNHARDISWHFTQDDLLVVNALGVGNLVDCKNWAVRTSITDFLLYDEANSRLICQISGGLAAFPVYDTQELLEMAAEALRGFQLTQEQKVSYGIDTAVGQE